MIEWLSQRIATFLMITSCGENPKKLLVVRTGNIKNRDLIRLFEKNIERIESLFKRYVLIEMNRSELIIHR